MSDELAGFAGRQRLRGLGIDHLAEEMILPEVQAVLRLVAFAGDARPDDLGEAIGVHGLDAEFRLEIAAHGVAPGLGAKAPVAQRELAQVDPHAFRDLGDVEGVGRRRAQNACAEILHQHDLPFGGAARDRHGGQTEPLGAVVESKPAGEQPVAVGIVEDVAGLGAHAGERAGHQVRPQVEVGPGIADDGRLAGRSRGGVQPHQLLARHREQAEGVIVAQVGFDRERESARCRRAS